MIRFHSVASLFELLTLSHFRSYSVKSATRSKGLLLQKPNKSKTFLVAKEKVFRPNPANYSTILSEEASYEAYLEQVADKFIESGKKLKSLKEREAENPELFAYQKKIEKEALAFFNL